MTPTWEAYGPYGNVLRTFAHKDQAQDYQARMATLGSTIILKRIVVQRRVA